MTKRAYPSKYPNPPSGGGLPPEVLGPLWCYLLSKWVLLKWGRGSRALQVDVSRPASRRRSWLVEGFRFHAAYWLLRGSFTGSWQMEDNHNNLAAIFAEVVEGERGSEDGEEPQNKPPVFTLIQPEWSMRVALVLLPETRSTGTVSCGANSG